jgi:DNA-binding beta-propeller fold protein YncE
MEGRVFMNISSSRRFAVCVSFLLLGIVALAGPQVVNYHLIKKVPLSAAPGGKEYFDYITIDPAARRLYLSHGTEIKVVDADNYAVVGTISGLERCHGIVLVKDLGKGFITDGSLGKVFIVDIATLKITGEVKAEPDADAIVYDPASKRIFSFNGNAKNTTVIDPVKGTVVKTIPLGGGPENAVADGKGVVYNNNEETNEVVVIDSEALGIKARWPVAPAGAPTSLAMDAAHRRLFSAGRNPQFLVVMNADNGKVIQSFPISGGADATVYEPETGLIFTSTRDGMIHVFHEDSPEKYSEVQTVKTEVGAKTMALDPKTHNLFLTTSDFNSPPAPTPDRPHSNPVAIPGTFRLLVYGR